MLPTWDRHRFDRSLRAPGAGGSSSPTTTFSTPQMMKRARRHKRQIGYIDRELGPITRVVYAQTKADGEGPGESQALTLGEFGVDSS